MLIIRSEINYLLLIPNVFYLEIFTFNQQIEYFTLSREINVTKQCNELYDVKKH